MEDNKEVVVVDDKPVDDKPVDDAPKVSEDEQRAINLGWKPKDQWQGSEDDWVPAKWWLKYGDVEQKAIILEQQDKHKEKVIASMKGHYIRVKEDAVKEALDIIKRQKREAVKNEDYQKVAELDTQADELEVGLRNRFKHNDSDVAKVEQAQGPDPDFLEWNRHNNWYKVGSGDQLTVDADTLGIGFKNRNPNATSKEILEYVEGKIKTMHPDKFKKAEPTPSAVDDGGSNTQSPTRSQGTKYKLSEAEKVAAEAFGISEAEYAKELQKFDQRKGR